MPLLDFATGQPCFQRHRRTHSHYRSILLNTFTCGKASAFPYTWKYFPSHKKFDVNLNNFDRIGSKFIIKAVATVEARPLIRTDYGKENRITLQPTIDSSPTQIRTPNGDSAEVDAREKLRRMRISKANKGNTAWNKGRKHSPETLRRIKEKTRLAMQDPKVKMKLLNTGHAQSKETRIKIGVGVQLGWQKRREKLMLQEACHFEWQNLIAEASRRGYVGEEEFQWDSYEVIDEKLEEEWLESVEQRKLLREHPKGSKHAPKSLEQRRRISEAISAKWSHPDYRNRVCSALAKYHGTAVGVERKPRRRPTENAQIRERSFAKKKTSDKFNFSANASGIQTPRPKRKKIKVPRYKDPLADSKLEMLKNIRAQRGVKETKKVEAIEQARLLIAEAEKAANALEIAAMRSPLAQASLVETRKLIAEANQSIQSIHGEQITSIQTVNFSAFTSTGFENHVEQENHIPLPNGSDKIKVNGHHSIALKNHAEFDFRSGLDLPLLDFDSLMKQDDVKLNGIKSHIIEEDVSSNSSALTRKWVCGRLIEVEGD